VRKFCQGLDILGFSWFWEIHFACLFHLGSPIKKAFGQQPRSVRMYITSKPWNEIHIFLNKKMTGTVVSHCLQLWRHLLKPFQYKHCISKCPQRNYCHRYELTSLKTVRHLQQHILLNMQLLQPSGRLCWLSMTLVKHCVMIQSKWMVWLWRQQTFLLLCISHTTACSLSHSCFYNKNLMSQSLWKV